MQDAWVEVRQEAAARLRRKPHDITTNKGVVEFLNDAVNAFVLDPEGISRQELNTLGYVSGIQLKAIAAVQAEDRPQDSLMDLLGGSALSVEIKMTKEERKMFLTAGSVDKMAQVLQEVKKDGRIIDVEQQADGSFAVPPTENPPRTDAPMPATLLASVMRSEGTDVTRDEVIELFGTSLGAVPDAELEEFGFDALLDATPKSEPALGHRWVQVSIENPDMPGVVTRRSKCSKCGVVTGNTSKLANEECGELG